MGDEVKEINEIIKNYNDLIRWLKNTLDVLHRDIKNFQGSPLKKVASDSVYGFIDEELLPRLESVFLPLENFLNEKTN